MSLLAISLLWPSPPRDSVRPAAISAARAIADRLRADVAYMRSDVGAKAEAEARRQAIARANESVQKMQMLFYATAYRPTELTTDARAVVRVVDELRWLDSIVLRSAPRYHPRRPQRHVCAVKLAAADVLAGAAELLENPRRRSERLSEAVRGMRAALDDLERAAVSALPGRADASIVRERSPHDVVSSLDPAFGRRSRDS